MFYFPLGEGVELRLLEDRHATVLFNLVDQNRAHLRAWMPWVDGSATVADTEAFIAGTLSQLAAGKGFQAGIWAGADLAGVIGYHPIDWANGMVEIGYWLAAAYQGRGIMTRAGRALVDHALLDLGLNRVQVQCATGNTRSRAIPERLGFVEEGTRRAAEWLYDHYVDLVMYRMLAADWLARLEKGGT